MCSFKAIIIHASIDYTVPPEFGPTSPLVRVAKYVNWLRLKPILCFECYTFCISKVICRVLKMQNIHMETTLFQPQSCSGLTHPPPLPLSAKALGLKGASRISSFNLDTLELPLECQLPLLQELNRYSYTGSSFVQYLRRHQYRMFKTYTCT